jgi:putative acyl-CoA dehydrogenase
MAHPHPRTQLATHEVFNQAPPAGDVDLFADDAALRDAIGAFGDPGAAHRLAAFGAEIGREEVQHLGHLANRAPPELTIFDRYGQRVDEVTFHPAYHELFALAKAHGVHNAAWTGGTHLLHTGLEYLMSQVEAGVCCPLTMTYAAVPALRHEPVVAAAIEPGLTSSAYDPRCVPWEEKSGLTVGMAMTEKQGGSDVRANTTTARPIGPTALPRGGVGDGWLLRGHKWFCSAPMSDGFLMLAQVDARELTCFFVPKWSPDGTRNAIQIQRLKDKLGNKSNASSEIELHDAFAWRVGEVGRGVRTILEMVHHTRLDCTTAAASLTRAALRHAVHHANHRRAFGKRLIEQPLMGNVLADLAVEVEAMTWMTLRVAHAFDRSADHPAEAAFARVAVAIAKYFTNKRCPTLVVEAMECLGGAGYVEETPLPRLYREAPLNGIWEGSGNVICLDLLRAMAREPEAVAAFVGELQAARGAHPALDAATTTLIAELRDPNHLELRARRLVERLAVVWAGGLLARFAPAAIADAWIATRVAGDGGLALGTLPPRVDFPALLRRAGATLG